MPGTHDLGGRSGFGPIPQDDAVFHEPWEAKSFALTQFAQGLAGFNVDGFRHGIEREEADLYLTLSYWHRGLRNANRMLIEGGVLPDGDDPAKRTTDCLPPEGRGAERPPRGPAAFSVGQQVRASSTPVSEGHTRLPSYVQGHVGAVSIVNGVWVYPDTNAHGQGEQPTWVYAVAFEAGQLWSDPTLTHQVIVDLFEPYLEPA